MWDDLLSTGGDFLEGAWESVKTGVTNGLGDWVGGSSESTSPAASVNAGQSATTTAATTAVNEQSEASSTESKIFGVDSKVVLVGAGLLVAALAVA